MNEARKGAAMTNRACGGATPPSDTGGPDPRAGQGDPCGEPAGGARPEGLTDGEDDGQGPRAPWLLLVSSAGRVAQGCTGRRGGESEAWIRGEGHRKHGGRATPAPKTPDASRRNSERLLGWWHHAGALLADTVRGPGADLRGPLAKRYEALGKGTMVLETKAGRYVPSSW